MSKKSGCAGCPKLALVPPDKKSSEERNFWNTCPRQLGELPNTPCSMGKPSKSPKGRLLAEPACEWWVDSLEDNYCFWSYVHSASLPNGKMDPLLQNEIAKKMACSSTKIHFIIKESIQKLKSSDNLEILSELSGMAVMDDDGVSPVPEQYPGDSDPEFSDPDREP